MPWTSAHAGGDAAAKLSPTAHRPVLHDYVHYAIDFSQQPYEEGLRLVPPYKEGIRATMSKRTCPSHTPVAWQDQHLNQTSIGY